MPTTPIKLLAVNHPGGQDEEQGIDFVALSMYLWGHKWPIIVIAAVVYLGAAIYASTLLPVYRTNALLKVEQKSQSVIGVESVSSMMGGRMQTSAELILIKSHSVLAAAIKELGLGYTVTPRYFPYFGAVLANRFHGKGLAEPLFGLDQYAWGGEVFDLDHFSVSGKLETFSTRWKLIADENGEYRLLGGNGAHVLSGKVGESASGEYQDSTIEIHVNRLLAHPGAWFTINRPSSTASSESLQRQSRTTRIAGGLR